MKDIKKYLKLKIKIKDKFYGIYGESSNFRAIKYTDSVLVPANSDYYNIGDVVLVLTFGYKSLLTTCVIADKDTLVDIDNIKEDEPVKPFHFEEGTSYIMGQDYYHYLAIDHSIYNIIELAEDYEAAFKQLISDLNNDQFEEQITTK